MTHLQETGQPLDNYSLDTQSACLLIGSFFPSSTIVPIIYWRRGHQQARLGRSATDYRGSDDGSRSSVMI
jgi:hypothetical protein